MIKKQTGTDKGRSKAAKATVEAKMEAAAPQIVEEDVFGEGSGQEIRTVSIDPVSLAKAKLKMKKDLDWPALTDAQQVIVVDEESYDEASELLSRIARSRATIKESLHTRIITPIRKGLDVLYEVFNNADKPWAASEEMLKSKMKDWKREEYRKEQERLRIEEAERLRLVLAEEAARRKAEQEDLTAKAKARAIAAAEYAATQRELIESQPAPPMHKAKGSSSAPVRKWKITDMHEFILGVATAGVPEDTLTIDTVKMNEYFKENPDEVDEWPGVEVYDDIRISKSTR